MMVRRSCMLLVFVSSLIACGEHLGQADEGSTSTSATQSDSGEAGETGEQADATCEPGADPSLQTPAISLDPEHVHTVSGQNGSFTDMCDADGNLLEYSCEVLSMCDGFPNPDCTYMLSGDVVPNMFDCAGTCINGTCVGRCPHFGDVVEFTSVAADMLGLHNQTDDRNYTCMVIFDNANDSYDCSSDPSVGETIEVTSLGLQGDWCTGTQGFNIGVGQPEQCAFGCNIVP